MSNRLLFRDNVRAMSGYTPGEQPRDRQFVKLNTNENPYPPSPAVIAALGEIATGTLNRYPDPVATDVREAAAEAYGLTGDWILAGNGSDDILTIVTRATVDPGGAIGGVDPSYSLYPVLAEIQGARMVSVPLADDWSLPADLAAQLADCDLIFLPRPNAPTGTAWPKNDIRRLCRDFDGVVLIDEAYADFAADNCLDLAAEFANVIVSRTVSKSYSLARIRLGLAIAQPPLITELMKVKDSYNVNGLTQAVGAAALRDQDYMRANARRICNTREMTAAKLRDLGFEVCPSQANFLFVRGPLPGADLMAGLRERGVLVRYFPGPRTGDYIRITIGTEAEMQTLLTAATELLG